MNEAELLVAIERSAREVFHACAAAAAADTHALREARAAEVVFRIAELTLRVRHRAGSLRVLLVRVRTLLELVAGGRRAGHRAALEELELELAGHLLEDDRDDELTSVADAFERKVG